MYVAARRRLSDEDYEKILVYNKLAKSRNYIPNFLGDDIISILGDDCKANVYHGDPVELSEGDDRIIEDYLFSGVDFVGETIIELPSDTVAIRIYCK